MFDVSLLQNCDATIQFLKYDKMDVSETKTICKVHSVTIINGKVFLFFFLIGGEFLVV